MAANCDDPIGTIPKLKPDVILMDILMPRMDGLKSMIKIKQSFPRSRLLIVTISDRENNIFQALRFGAQGYLLKSATVNEVVEAVKRTHAGEAIVSHSMAAKLIGELLNKHISHIDLSQGEIDLLGPDNGISNIPQTADDLCLDNSSVRMSLGRLMDRLHFSNRDEALQYIDTQVIKIHST